MPTLSEILGAARSLPPTQLGELRREVERLERESRAIHLAGPDGGDASYRLMRLTDPEYLELHQRSLAIYGPSVMVQFALWMNEERGRHLGLPAAYLTLKHLSGESGRYFDQSKCSFSFPFTLDVRGHGRTWPYLLNVWNTSGALDFSLRRVVDPRDPRLAEGLFHPPFEAEFGQEALDHFILYFVGYLTGVWESIRDRRHQPFVQGVAKTLVLFGYWSGRPFEKEYQREANYRAALRRYGDRVSAELGAAGAASRQSIARTIRDTDDLV